MNKLRSDFEASVLNGQEHLSDSHVITQAMVNEYAALTGDGEGEWVHLDPERAAQDPAYGGTIVQGFLQVSHLIKLHAQAMKARPVIDKNFALNYGFDRLRFVGQMPVGAKFRARVGWCKNRTEACCSSSRCSLSWRTGSLRWWLSGCSIWINGRLGRVTNDSAPIDH